MRQHICKRCGKIYLTDKHGKAPVSARALAQRGGFQTARKIGRNWVVDDAEPYPDRRVKTGKYKDWRTKMLKFNESSIENLSRASHDESNQDFNIYCAYYPRTGELSYKFGPKDHPQANDVKAPDGMAVMLDIIYRPVDAPEIKSMIESACRRALEKHPARKDLKGKL